MEKELVPLITAMTAITGLVIATISLTLSVLNYRRDAYRLDVSLNWDMKPFGNTTLDSTKSYGLITVRNTGRRTVFFSHPHLQLLGRKKLFIFGERIIDKQFISRDTLEEVTIKEGDPPKRYPVKSGEFVEYSKRWKDVRAVAIDARGKSYYSKPCKLLLLGRSKSKS